MSDIVSGCQRKKLLNNQNTPPFFKNSFDARYNNITINVFSVDLFNFFFCLVLSLDWLIFDEADQLLSKGWVDQTDQIIAECNKKADVKRGLFSATLGPQVRTLVDSFMHFPIEVTIGQV